MVLFELEQQVKPLSRQEKFYLIRYLLDLVANEDAEMSAAAHFSLGDQHGFWSPCDESGMAQQLQTLLEQPSYVA